jgi:ribonucleoside-diphosphate reductase alpha chain
MPQELIGASTGLFGGAAALPEPVLGGGIAESTAEVSIAKVAAPMQMDERTKAKMQGYEGDACGDCGNYTLVRNGTCMKCNTCGATSGCS